MPADVRLGQDPKALVLLLGAATQSDMVLAAVAAAWALNMSPELIAAGLRTFDASVGAPAPGRSQ